MERVLGNREKAARGIRSSWGNLPVDRRIRPTPEGVGGRGGDAAGPYVDGDAPQEEAKLVVSPRHDLVVGQHQTQLREVQPGVEQEFLGKADLRCGVVLPGQSRRSINVCAQNILQAWREGGGGEKASSSLHTFQSRSLVL